MNNERKKVANKNTINNTNNIILFFSIIHDIRFYIKKKMKNY